MYELLKRVLKGFLGKEKLIQYEERFRKVTYLMFKGNNYECNICNKQLRKFIQLPNGEKSCPYCGSLGRNRRLYQLLTNEFTKQTSLDVLDFSPSRCLYRKLKKNSSINYTSTDYADEFIADKKLDITAIEENDNSFDIILCYHILEHIEDDLTAMKELYRILKHNGKCFIQTPFKEGDIYENSLLKTPTERKEHFGQEDHVRIYSIKGLKSRLEKTSWKMETKSFEEQPNNRFGFNVNETILIGIKQ